MKKQLFIYCLLLCLFSCNEYRYTAKYHHPKVLFDNQQFAEQPSKWEFYVHGANNQTYKARSESLDSISFQAVLTKSEPVNVPKGLNRFESARKKEVHIFAKDSAVQYEEDFINNVQVFDLKKEDIIEIVSFTNPSDFSIDKRSADENEKKFLTIFSMVMVGFAAFILSIYYTLSNIGCYIATMVYGSYESSEVLVLRRFRDEKLKKTVLGKIFIANYYVFSPLFVKCFKNVAFVNLFIKKQLDRWVNYLREKNNW